MSPRLTGRVGIVTGAGRGIGRAIALGLAAEGMALGLLARTGDEIRDTGATAASYGVPVLPVAADVTDAAALGRLVAHAEQRLGPIDLVVNNAGRADATDSPPWTADADDVWSVVETNLRGPLLLTRLVLPAMVGRRQGRIVNVNSLIGARGSTTEIGYAVSKAALFRLTDSLAAALRGTGVHVFDISPGLVRTAMTAGMSRWRDVSPDEWTPPERAVDLVVRLAAGDLDALSGRFIHAGEDVDALLAVADRVVAADARVLRLVPYGPDDPLAAP